ncbi:MAG: RNA pseudouridine synthase [Cyclobacteriaceae bacterium]
MKASFLTKFKQSILFENQDYILVNKPPFLSTLEDRNDPVNLLRLAQEVEPNAQVCHRLDKDTSGVLAIARHPEAYRHLSIQFEQRQVKKIYHAVVDGINQFDDKMVDKSILKLSDGTVKTDHTGKSAQTFFTSLQHFKNHSLIQCMPVTGRMHQIRVHLAWLKAPITGDDTYGGKAFYLSSVKRGFNLKKDAEEEPFMKRMALHAYSLSFLGLNDEKLEVIAPYPKDFGALLKQLSQNLR